jgi:hypothetical protein
VDRKAKGIARTFSTILGLMVGAASEETPASLPASAMLNENDLIQ